MAESTREVWEVKPKNGKDPRIQLELYKRDGNYFEGHQLERMDEMPIIGSLKMQIDFPEKGQAIYSFYRKNNYGVKVPVTIVEARKEMQDLYDDLNKSINGEVPWLKQIFPGLPIPGVGTIGTYGIVKWVFNSSYKFWSIPTIGRDGTIYIASNDQNVYALFPDGSVKWSLSVGHGRDGGYIMNPKTINLRLSVLILKVQCCGNTC